MFGSTPMTVHPPPRGPVRARDTSDPALLEALLKVRDGAGGGYYWVECGACDAGWQVPHYAESVG